MATITESVKESLLGVSQPENLSQTSRTTFLKHARKDEESGEYYMGEDDFINAIAPAEEDYVSRLSQDATDLGLPQISRPHMLIDTSSDSTK